MTSGTLAHRFNLGGGPGPEWAPLLEFYSSNTSTDWLFAGADQSSQTNLGSMNITAAFPGAINIGTEGLDPSGMIVDNDSSLGQAARIYLASRQASATCTNNMKVSAVGGCAVKLTQAGLQEAADPASISCVPFRVLNERENIGHAFVGLDDGDMISVARNYEQA